ncbi:stress-induced-phosphoprotein 1-like [Saccostrea echinata]|uniref:stress-induced-phosphoprotein 1-like n=1 Tax=Saccostrea echinata TaxID=191078 RepID=UPI002A7F2B9E|nr:stress-induced-phosphoprotein 1-like [Saccostrea echinata]
MADVNKKKAEALKSQGNEALSQGKFEEAIENYTAAIQLDPDNHVLYSNRSAALTKAGNYLEAIGDADKAIHLKPDWAKGYSRKGTALCCLNRYEEANEAFSDGLKVDPDNAALKEGLEKTEEVLTGPGNSQPIPSPFAGPDVMEKLQANPKTREFLKQPDYCDMIEKLQKNPNDLKDMSDPRIITTLGVLLGFDISTPSAFTEENMEMDKQQPQTFPESQNASSPNPTPSEKSATSSTKNVNSKALEEKQKGNAAYKNKDFETALTHYSAAIELDPTDITFRNNRAAVYFEQENYDKCIEECEKAVEIGRENRADYTLIAKALARIGKAYMKKDDEENALRYFNKSISEYRTPEISKLIVEIEKRMKDKERLAYINPELSLEEKNKGNKLYQEGKYPEAKKHYDEAIKRNPDDAKLYSNRAACYTKLMEFNLALADCDKCIALDPKFIKGYLRKGGILLAMKEPTKAISAYQKALELDPKSEEAQKGYRDALMAEGSDPEAVRRRAMGDPEVQAILNDPAMRMILEQMQKDPNAVREHLKNPDIAAKIEKLLECGIIAIR